MFYYPAHLNIETSDYCNRSCAYCPLQARRDDSPPRTLDLALLDKLLVELAAAPAALSPLKISLQWIDEPLANPGFFAAAELCRARLPDARWLLQTNGDLVTRESAERLKGLFSAVVVNCYTKSAFERIARLELDVVRAASPRALQSPGRLKRIVGQRARADEAVFHFNRKFEHGAWVERHDEVQRPPDALCTRLCSQAAIAYNGDVHLCCRDNEKRHPVGNLVNSTLYEAYNSAEARRLRAAMERGRRDEIDMCRTCPLAAAEPVRTLAQSERPAPLFAPALDDDAPMPLGTYDYWTAREVASRLGHVALPGILPRRYEVVVGLTRALAEAVVAEARARLGSALLGIVVCGGRVMTRTQLQLVDPTVFEPWYRGPGSALTVGKKGRLRELGPDPRHSSDLDLKLLVARGALDDDERERLGRALGRALAKGARFPLSGHHDPILRLLEADPASPDVRAAFLEYNAARPAVLEKAPLSLEYVQLLVDERAGVSFLDGDARAEVRAALVEPSTRRALDELSYAAGSESEMLRASHDGLSGHQLVGALLDFPALDPPALVVEEGGRVVEGAVAAWAARRAGRREVSVVYRGARR